MCQWTSRGSAARLRRPAPQAAHMPATSPSFCPRAQHVPLAAWLCEPGASEHRARTLPAGVCMAGRGAPAGRAAAWAARVRQDRAGQCHRQRVRRALLARVGARDRVGHVGCARLGAPVRAWPEALVALRHLLRVPSCAGQDPSCPCLVQVSTEVGTTRCMAQGWSCLAVCLQQRCAHLSPPSSPLRHALFNRPSCFVNWVLSSMLLNLWQARARPSWGHCSRRQPTWRPASYSLVGAHLPRPMRITQGLPNPTSEGAGCSAKSPGQPTPVPWQRTSPCCQLHPDLLFGQSKGAAPAFMAPLPASCCAQMRLTRSRPSARLRSVRWSAASLRR